MGRLAAAALAALTACATANEPVPPPPSFRAVRSLALVRSADDRAGRPKDPLDGLDESLRARGYATRIVELGPRSKPELAALEKLFSQLELRASTGRTERLGAPPFGEAGHAAGEVVAQLGVDAVATYHRLDRSRVPPPPPSSQPLLPGSAYPPPAAPTVGPVGALGLVDRSGHVATFAWGAPTTLEDPSVPVNAAEAIDLLVRALTGEAPPEE